MYSVLIRSAQLNLAGCLQRQKSGTCTHSHLDSEIRLIVRYEIENGL